jgi:hypothetical protein
MEEMEVPTEHLNEQIKEGAEEIKERWSTYAAISTALMAVFAALGSLTAGHHSNEALIEQIKASDQWSYYQAKGIKAEIAQAIVLQHQTANAEPPAEIKEKQAKYKTDQEEIMKKAHEAEEESQLHLKRHVTIAQSVTLFQIAISISAIAMLTRKKFLWYFSLVLSVIGAVLFFLGNF